MDPLTLGFLVINQLHESGYATEIAKLSHHYNIQCVKFQPTSINPKTLMVSGQQYNRDLQQWSNELFPIPQYIYDRCFYHQSHSLKVSKPIVDWLKKSPHTTFLGFGLPDKWKLYTSLKSDPIISNYLPFTELVYEPLQVIRKLKLDGSCLLKPVRGSRGTGIIAAILDQGVVTITYHNSQDKKKKIFASDSEFSNWCKKLLNQHEYLIQPLLNLSDPQGYPFDVRVLLQKNANGEWSVAGKGVRKGYRGSFLSNLNSGGQVISWQDWISTLPPTKIVLLEDELRTIVSSLPPLLEKTFDRLFEIGIDIGYATDGSVWVLDINSKPGRKTILTSTPDLSEKIYEAPLAYCKYLQNQAAIKESN